MQQSHLQGPFFWYQELDLKDIDMEPIADICVTPPQFADAGNFHENELKRRVVACLQSRLPHPVAGVEVTVIGRTVVFRGDSLTAAEKRLCDECCRHVPGVTRVMEKSVVFETATGGQ